VRARDEFGYPNVAVMSAGIAGWEKAKQPTEFGQPR
jgi:3-mercaptopyruvate sulfurtransferase SseA